MGGDKQGNEQDVHRFGKCYERNEFMKAYLRGETVEGLLYRRKLGKLGNTRYE